MGRCVWHRLGGCIYVSLHCLKPFKPKARQKNNKKSSFFHCGFVAHGCAMASQHQLRRKKLQCEFAARQYCARFEIHEA